MKHQWTASAILLAILLALAFLQYDPSDRPDEPDASQLLAAAIKRGQAPRFMIPTDKAIEFFENKVKEDPGDFISCTIIGELHTRRARETGDIACYEQAEAACRRALKLSRTHAPALLQLAGACFAQHKFAEALGLAQEAYNKDPRLIGAQVMVAEAYLELGRYGEAERIFQELRKDSTDESAPVWVSVARFMELKGDHDKARKLIERAVKDPVTALGAREDVAWYYTRLGEFYFRAGEFEKAEEHYLTALKIWPDGYPALEHLAELRAAQTKYDEAIELYRKVIAEVPRPEFYQAIGDVYKYIGKMTEAQPWYGRAQELYLQATEQGKAYYFHHLATFYCDSREDPAQALKWARRDLELRQNVYAYDALAWALYRDGQFPESIEIMKKALAVGTMDAHLFYHASMISSSAGDPLQEKEYLRRAVSVNPRYNTFHVHR